MCCVQAVLPHFKEGASIINTTSINAFKGNASLIPYTATKGAEVRKVVQSAQHRAAHIVLEQCIRALQCQMHVLLRRGQP